MKTILIVLGLCFSAPAFALITLPFSTTYDCVEQTQLDGTWVTCDGLDNAGDWTATYGAACNLTAKEQITSAANYSGGGGGRGQRHMIGHSAASGSGGCVEENTNASGSISYTWATRVQEVYVRWYTRWEAGLKIGTASGASKTQKILYFQGEGCGSAIGGCVFNISDDEWMFTWQGNSWQSTFDQSRPAHGWNAIHGGAESSNTASTGEWHCIEVHLKNDSGANDDRVRMWHNDVLVFDMTGAAAITGSDGFNHFYLPENAGFTTAQGDLAPMYQDHDDVVVSTTGPIGCLAAGQQQQKLSMSFLGWASLLIGVGLLWGAYGASNLVGGYSSRRSVPSSLV